MIAAPRCEFAWESLPPALLRGLKRELALEGDASVALRKAYGARPSTEFVRGGWPVLLRSWLKSDRASRERVVEELHSRRLGDLSIAVNSSAGQFEYLGSCRNSTTLRGVVADALIAVGEPPSPPTAPRVPSARPKARSKTWAPFVTSLAASLSALDEDQYLIITRKDRNWFVQFAAQGSLGIRAELVSNSYLGPDEQIPKKAISTALKLGWIPPTGSPTASTPENDPDGSPNFYQEWEQPVAYIEVARMAVDTLVEVLAVPHPGLLEYRAFADEGTQILLPTLGLRVLHPEPEASDDAGGPLDAEAIAQRLLVVLRQVSGNDDLEVDTDGDIPLQYGSSMVFVRAFGDPPIVRVFSPVLREVPASADLDEAIGDLNNQFAFTKWLAIQGTIIASVDIFGDPLIEQHVLHACGVVGQMANDIDEQLQERFGGKTFFGEDVDRKLPPGAGGYL